MWGDKSHSYIFFFQINILNLLPKKDFVELWLKIPRQRLT